jgi:hypothetical protein
VAIEEKESSMTKTVRDAAASAASSTTRGAGALFLVLAFTLAQGCATNLSKPDGPPQPTSVKLSTFKTVAMKKVAIAPDFASAGANQKAAKKIDKELALGMRTVFPDLRQIDGEDVQTGLLIEPLIQEIKFIGGAARFWVGAMAGSSAVLMKATFRDASTGKVIGEPQFYRNANAYTGGWSFGATDNLMLDGVAKDIVNYAKTNQ